MSESLWKKLLKSALETEEIELTCEECFDGLDAYVELLLEGMDPAELMPMLKQHLNQCNCCTEEVKAMMVMLQDAAKDVQASSSPDG